MGMQRERVLVDAHRRTARRLAQPPERPQRQRQVDGLAEQAQVGPAPEHRAGLALGGERAHQLRQQHLGQPIRARELGRGSGGGGDLDLHRPSVGSPRTL